MQGFAKDKIPGGKLVQIAVDYGNTIQKITITGDFFVHPEEGIQLLERTLRGRAVSTTDLDFITYLNQAVTKHQLELVGITTPGIVGILRRALEQKGAQASVKPIVRPFGVPR